jgi:hypothetical protein
MIQNMKLIGAIIGGLLLTSQIVPVNAKPIASETTSRIKGQSVIEFEKVSQTHLFGTADDLQGIRPRTFSADSSWRNSRFSQNPSSEASEPGVNLQILSRVGAGYTTSGGSFDALVRIEGFLPLWQTPGKDIGFLEPRLALDDHANLGGSLILGYRSYTPNNNRILGGYVAFDGRGTDDSSFFQIGTGFESLGDVWDFRFNAYAPIGSRNQVVNDSFSDTGLQTSTRFQDHLLLLDRFRRQTRILQTETSLGGFDAEVGLRLAHWKAGDLRGFGGLYLYGSPNTPEYLGWRLRLFSNITPNVNAGLALQQDDLFGTRLIASIGATFPGIRPNRPLPETDRVRARLAESVVRLPEIAVVAQQNVEVSTFQESQPLINPEEEQPYWFQHVTLGATEGDGTFEKPFGTVQRALNATRQDGNDVVYVKGDANISIPAFTIPERVQVLSQGPRQFLAGLPFPGFPQATVRLPFAATANYADGILVELPFSGDGNFPRVINGVTLSNRTTLAGFRIENSVGNAITGRSISNVELRNNTITNPSERGIFLDDVGGSVILFDNLISGAVGSGPASGQGIFIRNTTTLNAVEVTIAGYQADTNRVGIEITAQGGLVPTPEVPNQVITIGPSSPDNTSIGTYNNVPINNRSSNNRDQGILIQSFDLGSQEVSIVNSTIQNNGAAGIEVNGGTPGGFLATAQEVRILDSLIANNAGAGIDIEANETTAQELNVDGNVIRDNAGAGIQGIVGDTALLEVVTKPEFNSLGIGNNTIAGNGGPGIVFQGTNSDILLIEVNQNRFNSNAAGVDLAVTSNNATRACVMAFSNSGTSTIRLTNNASVTFDVGELGNLSTNNNGATVNLLPNPAAFTNLPRRVCL